VRDLWHSNDSAPELTTPVLQQAVLLQGYAYTQMEVEADQWLQ
jgi:hypothetical protein